MYIDSVSKVYKKSNTAAYASDTDRTLISAGTFLAGMHILEDEDEWLPGLFWEPIPIHTTPVEKDAVLAQNAPCSRRDKLFEEQKKSEFYTNLTKENAELFEFLSNKTGWKINDIEDVEKVYATMYVHRNYNEKYVPDWYNSLNQTHLKYLAGLSMARKTSTRELKRLVAGPLIEFLFNYYEQIMANNGSKFLILSAHGHTVAAFLNTVGYFHLNPPEYGVCVMLEMYKRDDGTFYIAMTYKSYDWPALDPFALKGCHKHCDYKLYRKILGDVAIGGNDWKKECNNVTIV